MVAVSPLKFDSEFKSSNIYRTNYASPLKYIFSHTKRYSIYFGLAIIFQILATTFQSLITVYIGNVVANISNLNLEANSLLINVFAIAGFGVTSGVLTIARSFLFEVIGLRVERNARDELYSAILEKSLSFHDSKKIGDLMVKMTSDVSQFGSMIPYGFQQILYVVLGIIVPLIFIVFINPQLLLVPIFFLLMFMYGIKQFASKLSPAILEQRYAITKLYSRLNECLSGINQVRYHSQEEYEQESFLKNNYALKDASINIGKIQGRYYPILYLGIAIAFSFVHGAVLVSINVISFAQLITFLLLVFSFRLPTYNNIASITSINSGLVSTKRIIELLQEEDSFTYGSDGHATLIKGYIEFNNLSFYYTPDNFSLKNITFSVEPGQTVALVGTTGSGKSTIGKLLNRLYDPLEGEIKVDFINLQEWSISALRNQIAIVEQDIFLYSWSILENIKLGKPEATKKEVVKVAKLVLMHDFIMTLPKKYDTLIGERGIQLSGGQRQRVSIARAILCNPAILILDDASSSIDSKTEEKIQKAMANVFQGRVVFLITNRIAQIRKADQIIVLAHGKIIAQGTHDKLMKSSKRYNQIFSSKHKMNHRIV